MLHHAILPHSKLWGPFLTTLKYVVVDGKYYLKFNEKNT